MKILRVWLYNYWCCIIAFFFFFFCLPTRDLFNTSKRWAERRQGVGVRNVVFCRRLLKKKKKTQTTKFCFSERKKNIQDWLKAECVRCAAVYVLPAMVYQQPCGSSWLKITIFSQISWALSTYCGSIGSLHSTHSVEDKESRHTLHPAASVSTLKFKSLAIFISSAATNHFWAGLNLVTLVMSRSFQIYIDQWGFLFALCFLATLVPS